MELAQILLLVTVFDLKGQRELKKNPTTKNCDIRILLNVLWPGAAVHDAVM